MARTIATTRMIQTSVATRWNTPTRPSSQAMTRITTRTHKRLSIGIYLLSCADTPRCPRHHVYSGKYRAIGTSEGTTAGARNGLGGTMMGWENNYGFERSGRSSAPAPVRGWNDQNAVQGPDRRRPRRRERDETLPAAGAWSGRRSGRGCRLVVGAQASA